MSIILVANTYGTGAEINNNLIQKSLLILFGFVMSGLFIFWLSYNIEHLSGKSGITSFVLNMLLVTVILGLIYQTIFVQLPAGNAKKNAFFAIFSNTFYYLACLADSKQNAVSALIINSLFYIPCLVRELFRGIGGLLSGQGTSETTGSWIMLLTALALFVAYFKSPALLKMINVQGGKLLVNQPVSTDTQYNLGNYIKIHGSESFDYKYAISCWIYIDAAGANMNANYNKYTSLLNFGNKPNVMYNGKKHSLMITINQTDAKNLKYSKLTDVDDEGNRILYVNDQFLLQKWNNLIINYNGGTMDIFLNGELVQSSIEVVPYYTFDNLTIGENNGIKGGICNVVYYKEPLKSQNIYMIYNTAKNMTPPVVDDSGPHLPLNKSDANYTYKKINSNITKTVDSNVVKPTESKAVKPTESNVVKPLQSNVDNLIESNIGRQIDSNTDKYLS